MKGLGGDERPAVRLAVVVGVVLATIAFSCVATDGAGATTLPAGYQESVVFSGLANPTVVRFSSDGRVFVAEKSGLIKVFDNLTDTTPTVFADLRTNVHNFWDRGLLGMVLAPGFPADPSVYVLYTYDAAIGGTAPRWGTAGFDSDGCPSPPGATSDGCVVSGRLSRLQANGNVMTGPEQVLIEDWCQQYPSHSVGSLAFGADGALYASGGDGASFGFADYGQNGSPLNPCGDPPGGVGGTMTAPTAEGGALRSQDVRSTGDTAGLNGSIIRVDPATGAGLPDNPLGLSSDPNAKRVIAHGFRNPFRITVKPGTSDVWVGDVGWGDWEEIDVVTNQPDLVADNYGWPCYEGTGRQGGYDGANLTLCESLYAEPAGLFAPFFAYNHAAAVVPGEACPTGSSSIAGLAFETGSNFPAADDGALFFADYSRDCIWRVRTGSNGAPDPATVSTFAAGAANPVDLVFGADGALYYADFDAGTVRRISYIGGGDTTPPTVSLTAPANGSTVSGVITLEATASDAGGVAGVQFLLDGQAVGSEDATSPYSISWDTTTAGNGGHTLTAFARDTSGTTTASSAVSVTVGNSLQSLFANGSLETNLDGWGWHQGEVTRSTDFALVGTFSLKFVASAAEWAHGAYAGGLSERIGGVSPGAVHSASAYLFAPSAHPDVTPRIEWFDSSNVPLGVSTGQTTALPANAWTQLTVSASAPTGANRATVTFYADGNNGSTVYYLDDFQFTKAGAPGDQTPPAVQVTQPEAAATLSGTTTVAATATDAGGVAGVQFLLDGQAVGSEDVTSPFSVSWDTSTAGNGSHTLAAVARDTSGNTAVSSAVSVTVQNTTLGCANGQYLARYYDNMTLSGSAALQRCEAVVDNDWGVGVPAVGVPADGFSVSWQGTFAFVAGTTTFTLRGDDGIRLYVDNQLVIDGWVDQAATTYTAQRALTSGNHDVRIEYYENGGDAVAQASWTTAPTSTAPSASISSPAAGTTWKVGDPISFSATGTDAQGAPLPGTAFDWVVLIQHCPSNCHTHTYQTFDDTASGSFPAPDHEYPSYIQLRVTATDADGKTATASLDVQPRTVDLTFASSPPGLSLAVGAEVAAAPFTRAVIIGSTNSVSAVTPQFLAIASYDFVSWSDNGGATHNVTAPATATTYTATYVADKTPPTVSVTAPANGSTVSGAVTLQATASDAGGVAGVQFKLDGANLGAEDTSSPYQAQWNSAAAPSGPHTLTAVARDASGNTATSAPIAITVQSSTACPAGQWKAEYFPNRTLTGSPTVTQCENAIANDWGSGSPVAGIGADNFSVRWSGRFPFPAGSTTFFVTADDGVRLRVDGALAIDQWKDQGATTYRSRQTLAVGDHDVSVEYYEKTGSAVAKASWRSSLVASYTFNESSGSSVVDGSANGNTGTITGASRTNSGKFGRALSFNGTSNWVTIADAGVLDLSTQMTIEAWVYPTTLGSVSRSVVVKEAAATLSYGLDAHRSSLPGGRVNTGTVQGIQAPVGLANRTWTHLTVTYNGAVLRFYVNGALVTSRATTGTMAPSTGVLRIGGSSVASEWFAGRIDDVRLYARTLEQSEIQTDMAAELP